MASRVGSIFVELDLDDKPYRQLTQRYPDLHSGHRQGYRNIMEGARNSDDATYDAMRRSYENALTLIKNATTSTAQDIIRAEQAKNEKIKALNDQQFGHQKTGLEMLKGHYMAFSIAAVAAVAAVSKAWSMAKAGADFEEQRGILDNLGANMARPPIRSLKRWTGRVGSRLQSPNS